MPAGRTNVGRVHAGVWRSDRRATVAMGGRAGCAGGSDMWVAGDMWSGEVGAAVVGRAGCRRAGRIHQRPYAYVFVHTQTYELSAR